jgi:hypothetical protein
MDSSIDPRQSELVAWLHEHGHSSEEVAKIMAHVLDYDAQTINESIFDSIGKGDFDLAELIENALRDGSGEPGAETA